MVYETVGGDLASGDSGRRRRKSAPTSAVRLMVCLVVLYLIAACGQEEPSIAGVWKHSGKPAWIDIRFEAERGSASISRHDDNPNAVGLPLMSEIVADEASSGLWSGRVYDAASDGFVPVALALLNPELLVISTVEEGGNETEVLRLERD